MQPMVKRALKTKETLKIFLVITHTLPICNALFLDRGIFKKSTSKSENLLAHAIYLYLTIRRLEHNLKRDNRS
jgi:hypothetical protein